MTALERIRQCLVDQGKCLDFDTLRDKEKPARDGVPRRQLVELQPDDVIDACGPEGEDKIVNMLCKGSTPYAGTETTVILQVRDVLHLLKVKTASLDEPLPPVP